MKKLRSFLGPNGRKFNWSGAWNMSMCVNTQTVGKYMGVCVCAFVIKIQVGGKMKIF